MSLFRYLFCRARRLRTVSEEAVQRLARLGYATEADLWFWRDLWRSDGESFFWSFLRKTEEAAEEHRRWFPRLQDLAAECRRAVPPPSMDRLSSAEQVQYRILLAKMQEFVGSGDRCVLRQKPTRAAILYTTRIGLAAAQEVFGGTEVIPIAKSGFSRTSDDPGPPSGGAVLVLQGILTRSRPQAGRLHRKCGRAEIRATIDREGGAT